MRLVVLALLVLAGASPDALAEGRGGGMVAIADRPSLGAVLRQIGQRYPGRALVAQAIERDGRALYRIKWLGTDGQVRDITADARTGEILRVR